MAKNGDSNTLQQANADAAASRRSGEIEGLFSRAAFARRGLRQLVAVTGSLL